MPLWPPFIGPSYVSQSPTAASERTVNFYLEQNATPGTPYPWVLCPTPGATLLNDPGAGTGRGLFYDNGRAFCVFGSTLYEINVADWSLTNRGTLANDADNSPVRMTANGAGGSLFITASGVGYNYVLATNTLSTVLAGGAHQCGMLDGFVWVLDRTQSALFSSPALDATTFPGFQFRDMAPDPWRAAVSLRRQILLCGERSSEVFYNVGTSPFPFAPHPSGGFGVGIAAVESLARIGDGAIWLAQDADGIGDVVLLEGTEPRSVANFALRTAIEGYSRISDAIGSVYQERGHTFYVLTFPTPNKTWCFDLATGDWHERGSWIAQTATYEQWRLTWHALFNNTHVWIDRDGGALYKSDLGVFTDVQGRAIRRMREGPILRRETRRLSFPRFALHVEMGLGTAPQSFALDASEASAIFVKDFEAGMSLSAEGARSHAGVLGGVDAANTVGEGLNATGYGVLASGDYPQTGYDLGAPGFGTARAGWAEFWTDFSRLQEFGWTLLAATAGNYTTTAHALFDLYVGTESGSRYFWLNTGKNITQVQSPADLFAADTAQKIRVEWEQSTYTAGVVNADGAVRVFVNDTQVWEVTGLELARGNLLGDTDAIEITRLYANPCGRIDEIRIGTLPYATAAVDEPAGVDPRVLLEYSNDSGKTWIDAGWRSAGRQGEYDQDPPTWNRTGSATAGRKFRVVMTDPIPWRVLGGEIDVTGGA